jgi:hypothetical protein
MCHRYNPRCGKLTAGGFSVVGADIAAASESEDPTVEPNLVARDTRKAAYWDAAEKFYSVCQYGRSSVGNDVGQYNTNVGKQTPQNQGTSNSQLNPDANFANYYNIRYSNTGAPDNTLPLATGNNPPPALTATTYSPEMYSSEVRYIMPPTFAASFPMCVQAGTSTPTGSVTATAVDGDAVILPLRCITTHDVFVSSHPLVQSHLQPYVKQRFVQCVHSS